MNKQEKRDFKEYIGSCEEWLELMRDAIDGDDLDSFEVRKCGM